MPNDRPVRWLLVGTGDVVRKRVAEALHTTPGSTIVAVVGGLERARAIAAPYGAAAFPDIGSALAGCDCDAVYLATPVDRHRDGALAAAAAKKPVLIEKPLGLSAEDARAIADACAAAGIAAGCAYYRRCFPRYQRLRRALAAGELGPLVLVRTSYYGWFDPKADDPKRWRIEADRAGGGPLMDMGSHMLDLVVGLLGMPESVTAVADTLVHDWRVEDSVAAVLRYPGGPQVLASFGWNSKAWAHDFEVVGREGRVRWAPADDGPVTITMGRETSEEPSPNEANVHRPLVADLVAALREGRPPVCPLADALRTSELLDAIYRSAREHRPVDPRVTRT